MSQMQFVLCSHYNAIVSALSSPFPDDQYMYCRGNKVEIASTKEPFIVE